MATSPPGILTGCSLLGSHGALGGGLPRRPAQQATADRPSDRRSVCWAVDRTPDGLPGRRSLRRAHRLTATPVVCCAQRRAAVARPGRVVGRGHRPAQTLGAYDDLEETWHGSSAEVQFVARTSQAYEEDA